MKPTDVFTDEIQQLIFKMLGFAGLDPKFIKFGMNDECLPTCDVCDGDMCIVAHETTTVLGDDIIVFDVEKSIYVPGTWNNPPESDVETVKDNVDIWTAVEYVSRILIDEQIDSMEDAWTTRNSDKDAADVI